MPMKTHDELIPSQLSVRSACLDAAIVVVATFLLLYVVEPLVGGLVGGYEDRALYMFPGRLVSAAAAVGLALLLLRTQDLPVRTIGVKTKDLGSQVVFGVLAVPLVYVAAGVNFAAWWCIRQSWPDAGSMEYARRFFGQLAAEEAFGLVIALNATIACTEEILFRGFLLTRLRRIFGAWLPAALVSSVLFGFLHLPGAPHACGAFLVSLVLSYVYVRSGSLVTVAVTHFVFNCAQLVLLRQLLSG